MTLPNIKWGLLYGVILCNARAMGEFGAVYVVGGRIAGETDTMPLQVEKLFSGFNTPGAFAVASVLTLLAAGDARGRRPGWKVGRRIAAEAQRTQRTHRVETSTLLLCATSVSSVPLWRVRS